MNPGSQLRANPAGWQDAAMGTTMLLDAASMYFRAFYGVKEPLTAPDGTPVNAVRGLLDMITRLLRTRHPNRLIACMDASWRPAFRVAALPSYKAHRANPDGSEQVPEALTVQLPIIVDVLSAIGITMAWADGYEADDIIGTLAAQASEPVEVVTGDRDLFQLADEARGIRVAYIGKGVANLELMDEAAVAAKYQIPGRSYAAFAALRGDPSDGLPGVPGIGEKTAAALVRVFGSVEAMLAAIDAGHGGFPAGSRAKLVAARAYLDVCMPVVLVATDAPVKLEGGELPLRPADPARVAELDERFGLGSSLGRVLAALASAP
jgi:5'-3' exonuclease